MSFVDSGDCFVTCNVYLSWIELLFGEERCQLPSLLIANTLGQLNHHIAYEIF